MPHHTPSPHRFLAPAQPSSQKPRTNPQSSLRHGFTAQTPVKTYGQGLPLHIDREEQRKVTPAKRFVIGTPSRFAPRIDAQETGLDGENEDSTAARTQAISRTKTPRLNKIESIDESSPASSANAVKEHDVLQSVEGTTAPNEEAARQYQDHEDEEMLFVIEERNKRRRTTPQGLPHPHTSPPSSPASLLSSPRRQVHTPAPAFHRFKMPVSKTPATLDNQAATTTQTPPTTRPHFILPRLPSSPSKTATPLPETFSPSRKNNKYIPDGLASTLQSWILETGETSYSARSNAGSGGVIWSRDREDGVRTKLRVTHVDGDRHSDDGSVECWAGGVVFVKGVTDAGLYNASRASSVFSSSVRAAGGDGAEDGGGNAEIAVLLAGQGGARGKARVRIREGDVVGIRAPSWSVDVGVGEEGASWVVGVDWVIL